METLRVALQRQPQELLVAEYQRGLDEAGDLEPPGGGVDVLDPHGGVDHELLPPDLARWEGLSGRGGLRQIKAGSAHADKMLFPNRSLNHRRDDWSALARRLTA